LQYYQTRRWSSWYLHSDQWGNLHSLVFLNPTCNLFCMYLVKLIRVVVSTRKRHLKLDWYPSSSLWSCQVRWFQIQVPAWIWKSIWNKKELSSSDLQACPLWVRDLRMWLALHTGDWLVRDVVREMVFLLQLIPLARTIVSARCRVGRIYSYRYIYIYIYMYILSSCWRNCLQWWCKYDKASSD
jgi:hypothetical protein